MTASASILFHCSRHFRVCASLRADSLTAILLRLAVLGFSLPLATSSISSRDTQTQHHKLTTDQVRIFPPILHCQRAFLARKLEEGFPHVAYIWTAPLAYQLWVRKRNWFTLHEHGHRFHCACTAFLILALRIVLAPTSEPHRPSQQNFRKASSFSSTRIPFRTFWSLLVE